MRVSLCGISRSGILLLALREEVTKCLLAEATFSKGKTLLLECGQRELPAFGGVRVLNKGSGPSGIYFGG